MQSPSGYYMELRRNKKLGCNNAGKGDEQDGGEGGRIGG